MCMEPIKKYEAPAGVNDHSAQGLLKTQQVAPIGLLRSVRWPFSSPWVRLRIGHPMALDVRIVITLMTLPAPKAVGFGGASGVSHQVHQDLNWPVQRSPALPIDHGLPARRGAAEMTPNTGVLLPQTLHPRSVQCV